MRAGPEQRADERLPAQNEAALAGTELHARGRRRKRHHADERAGHSGGVPVRVAGGRAVQHLQGAQREDVGSGRSGESVDFLLRRTETENLSNTQTHLLYVACWFSKKVIPKLVEIRKQAVLLDKFKSEGIDVDFCFFMYQLFIVEDLKTPSSK